MIATLAVLALLAVTQLVIYDEGGWNVGLVLLALLVAGNLTRGYLRRS